jgi:hypothetical protein
MRGLARALLLVLVAVSSFATWRAGLAVMRDPALRPMIEASADQIIATTDQVMATEATPVRLTARIAARLTETPRNWVAIDALREVSAERDIRLPADLTEAIGAAQDIDNGVLARLGGCAACAWDIGQCGLSQALVCKAPILMTPVEDLRGIIKAGVDYSTGAEIDQLDLGLSVVGLSATALVLVSGGTSGTIKAGTALARLARGMRLLSPRLTLVLTTALRRGIDWAALPAVRGSDDLVALVRAEELAPLVAIASDLGRTADAAGATRALHLLPLVEDAADARTLARASKALGPRVVGRADILGKARLFRATVRVGSVATELVSGIVGLFVGLGTLIAGMVQSALLRGLRRMAR